MRSAAALLVAALALAQALAGAPPARAGETGLGGRYCLALSYVNGTAVVRDVTRVDYLIVVNHIKRYDGKPLDTPRGHNDDALTTGRFIAVLVEAYEATGDEGLLRLAERLASVFDPDRLDGPVFSDNDNPSIYLEYDKPNFRPEEGMVFWGSNGTHWFHPSDEQAVGAVYGLYKLWEATGDERYAEWLVYIAERNFERSSSLLRAIMAEAAYQVTGDDYYRRVADEAVRLYIDSIRAKYRPGTVWCVTSFGTVYVYMALEFERLRDRLLPVAIEYTVEPILRALYNKTTGAVYFKRALYPSGATSFYDPRCSSPEEAPGGELDATGVQNILYNFNLVVLLAHLYNYTGDTRYLNIAERVLEHYAAYMIVRPGGGYHPSVVGSFPPFAFDYPLPPTNSYVAANKRIVSTQATVAFLRAYQAVQLTSGEEVPECPRGGGGGGEWGQQAAAQPAQQPAGGWEPGDAYRVAVIALAAGAALASTLAQARRAGRRGG